MNFSTLWPLLSPLLGGFFAAWVFYGLAPFRKPPIFERVLQAFIFTLFAQALAFLATTTTAAILAIEDLPHEKIYGHPITAVFCGALIGLIFARCAQVDWPHKWLRRIGLTKRTSYGENNWGHAFDDIDEKTSGDWEVVLHFKDGRRLQGEPSMWPDFAEQGHFLLRSYRWLSEKGNDSPQTAQGGDFSILIDSADIAMIELFSIKASPQEARQ